MIKISVFITTIGRPDYLGACLESLTRQTLKPNEVVVIDNSYGNFGVKNVCQKFQTKLSINYQREKNQGMARARNKGLRTCNGDILVSLDDDCVASHKWLETMTKVFGENSTVDVVIGKTANFYPNSVPAAVYQCYYQRWLLENKLLGDKRKIVDAKRFCDFKNMAFKKIFIKNYQCSLDLPFKGWYDDTELGHNLGDRGKFYFEPKMLVYHRNPHDLILLLRKNYLRGVASEELKDKKGIKVITKISFSDYIEWLKECKKTIRHFNYFNEILFWIILLIYPVSYKLGHLTYKLGTYK